jgi:VIT1/CCC1 family predicted Fe2+/Mn2+ transporter
MSRGGALVPHAGPAPPGGEQRPLLGGKSGALRAAIFGVNDGLVSNLALIMGVAGAGVSREVILLAGVAGLLAGAFSMAAGEYVSMRMQREAFERLIHYEAHEIATDPEGEERELAGIYEEKGIPPEAAVASARAVMRDPRLALEVHAREELGLDPGGLGSPWKAAGSSLLTFTLGAAVPLIPFVFAAGWGPAVTAVTLALAALFGVGSSLSTFTGRRWLWSGARMVLIGGGAALVTFSIGRLLGVAAL